jgi:hypothetical protein
MYRVGCEYLSEIPPLKPPFAFSINVKRGIIAQLLQLATLDESFSIVE